MYGRVGVWIIRLVDFIEKQDRRILNGSVKPFIQRIPTPIALDRRDLYVTIRHKADSEILEKSRYAGDFRQQFVCLENDRRLADPMTAFDHKRSFCSCKEDDHFDQLPIIQRRVCQVQFSHLLSLFFFWFPQPMIGQYHRSF